MEDKFLIYIRRLEGGKSEEFDERVSAREFIDSPEKELSFKGEIHVKGKVYLADDHLIFQFGFEANVQTPCSICNEMGSHHLANNGAYMALPVDEIKNDLFDCKQQIREAIYLEIPQFAECEGGCKKRSEIDRYRAKSDEHHPFADLELDNS